MEMDDSEMTTGTELRALQCSNVMKLQKCKAAASHCHIRAGFNGSTFCL